MLFGIVYFKFKRFQIDLTFFYTQAKDILCADWNNHTHNRKFGFLEINMFNLRWNRLSLQAISKFIKNLVIHKGFRHILPLWMLSSMVPHKTMRFTNSSLYIPRLWMFNAMVPHKIRYFTRVLYTFHHWQCPVGWCHIRQCVSQGLSVYSTIMNDQFHNSVYDKVFSVHSRIVTALL